MIVWLASYPRSGNTFLRILLHRLFGVPTLSVYSMTDGQKRIAEDVGKLMRLVGQMEEARDINLAHTDSVTHFVKTHNLPEDDHSPAIVLVRDGRDAVVSHAHFYLKTERGIDDPRKEVFEGALEQIITGDHFGGWSGNVNAWTSRVHPDMVIRFEDLIDDPLNIVNATVRRLGINVPMRGEPPSFEELHGMVPWFFRKGKSGGWRQEMPPHLEKLFLERHGGTLRQLGYLE
jgi:hypothetical protein